MKIEKSGVQRIEKEWADLSKGISEVVCALLKHRKITQNKLAAAIGYPQSAISDVLNPKKENRRWSFHLLLLIQDYLGIPLYEIIRAAQTRENIPWLTMLVSKTPPHTMDRLELIIRAVAPEGTSEAVLNLVYSAQMFSIAAPDYVRRYADGELTDEEVYNTLKEAIDSASDDGNIWTRIHEMLNPDGKGPFSRA